MKANKPSSNTRQIFGAIIISGALSACSTTPTQDKIDPWEGWNRDVHGFNKDFDSAILKPIAKGYDDVMPNPVDESITNVFSNINDIGVTINDFLQLKFLQGGMDFSRFLINTTVGVVGVFDVAKELDLPKHDEDFGQTLGYWGVPTGNYMVLPFIGASSPRDAFGLLGDALFNPLTYVSFFGGFAANAATAAATGVDITDTRSDLMQSEKLLDEASLDRYDFVKNTYLQRRNYLVHDGKVPQQASDDPWVDDNASSNTTNNNNIANQPVAPSNATNNTPLNSAPILNNSNTVNVIDNSTTMPKSDLPATPQVIDNSKHILDLTAPEDN